MKYVREICIIFGMSVIGEVLNKLLPLPVPAGVYGLFILLFLLCTGIVKTEQVEGTGNFLLDTMPLMFVPISVGLMESFGELKSVLLPFVAVSVLSTVVVMTVTGKTADFIIKWTGKKGEGI